MCIIYYIISYRSRAHPQARSKWLYMYMYLLIAFPAYSLVAFQSTS